ncbi:ribonuclease R [Sphaerisporangium siamense]|uniref:Exoribonuclease R n=1 Tax=Sphaerisporangium siamense TaxID=795645 RepID=A0A7W7GE16_9ACTN|nr:RNB domain-containing ribonuclease [Sphaerisporangium siamense]MBB4703586.1 exoribonuclease R [Sphaerisporangium siamense]GII82057.1 ribonuclease R [Sphaerisporangium siamense]
MPPKAIHVSGAPKLAEGFDRIRAEMELPDAFPGPVVEEARRVAGAAPYTAHTDPGARRGLAEAPEPADRTDLPLLTIDPPGSMDLDQALCLEQRGEGYRVWYAIADVAAFVPPGGVIDAEARRRVETVYLPDGRVPLHPAVLSEGAASLLPGVTRPAALWCLDLDSGGAVVGADVSRALVRSRERLDYDYAQAAVDTGTADGTLRLLPVVGSLRLELERARGGVTLPTPEQEVVPHGDGYRLEFRCPLPAEAWNAQISLMTGMAAASMMLDAEIGVLRTLPAAPPDTVARVRRIAEALGVPWPASASFGEVVHGLDPSVPRNAAFLHESTVLLRGAAYTAFNGEPPKDAAHAAVAAPYAHVTAPLRRLADRYATEVCLAVAAGVPVPEPVQEALAELPALMAGGGRRAAAADRACVDLVEAFVLRDRVGQTFGAVVVDVEEDRPGGLVQVADPAVVARCDGDGLRLGARVEARLTRADVATREVRFTVA